MSTLADGTIEFEVRGTPKPQPRPKARLVKPRAGEKGWCMMDRLTAEQIEELERLRDDRNSADPDRYIGAGTRFQLALDNYSDALLAAARANAALREALTPSANTKAAYMGEFSFQCGEFTPNVPWTCIKEIMAAIKARAENDRLGAMEDK